MRYLKLVTTATVLFLWSSPAICQEKAVDKADTIITKLTEISKELMDWKKENEARMKKSEEEVKQLRAEIAELKQSVAKLKVAETPKQVESPKVVENPPVAVKPSTIKIVNTWGPAKAVVNGVLHKIPLGTTKIQVPPGKFTYRVLEIAGSTVKEYSIAPGSTWVAEIYPLPPTVPLLTKNTELPPIIPLVVPNNYQGEGAPLQRCRLWGILRR